MKTPEQQLAEAIALASHQFAWVFDKAGKPYILHCLEVMNGVSRLGFIPMTIAVIHDIIEDTSITGEMLLGMGFDKVVVDTVRLLTHSPEEPYEDYIKRIGTNHLATQIKLADLTHNMQTQRLKNFSDKDMSRLVKYHKAFVYLTGLQAGGDW